MSGALVVILAAVGCYLGTVGAAFASLMRLSLRLVAERTGRSARLGVYLDDPVQLFLLGQNLIKGRLGLGIETVAAQFDAYLLGQIGHGEPGGPIDNARIDILLAAHDPEQGRFARAVHPGQPDPVTGMDLHRDVAEDMFAAVLQVEVVDAEHEQRWIVCSGLGCEQVSRSCVARMLRLSKR